MTTTLFSASDLEALAAFDTPTICNALERLSPATQARGYTTQLLLCGFPALKPVVGYARTATIRAVEDTDLLSIGKDDFERLVATDRQLADAVKRISHQRAISNLSAGGTESAAAIATLLKRSHHAVRKRAHLLEIKLARSLPGPKPKWK